MTLGPPPSAAGPSHNTTSNGNNTEPASFQVASSFPPPVHHVQSSSGNPEDQRGYLVHDSLSVISSYNTTTSQPYSSASYAAPTSQVPPYGYYNYPPNSWGNTWPVDAYPYRNTGASPSQYRYAQAHVPPPSSSQLPSHPPAAVQAPVQTTARSPSASPSPPSPFHRHWDAVIKTFLSSVGLTQALRGFEADMVIMNPEWERKKVPIALGELMKDLLKLAEDTDEQSEDDLPDNRPAERPLEERKLDYVHFANGVEPRSPTSITKSISLFLAQNRSRNDASNRNEFLQSSAEKRRRLNELGDFESSGPIPSCARTDAKTQNRDVQMKYDIAKNEDGPLRKTLRAGSVPGAMVIQEQKPENASAPRASGERSYDNVTTERYPALDERLQNVETHLAVRYVPCPPRSLLDRVKFLEDHIVLLEKEYPPWAALHFNQPNRGWPPPPRSTPIIVPSHLTSTAASASHPHPSLSAAQGSERSSAAGSSATTPVEPGAPKGRGKQARNTKSSLHRAVMERLEVQKAMKDLAGIDEGG